MGNHLYLVHQVGGVIRHSVGLVSGVQPLLQFLVVGGDPGRAGVPVALQGLHATQGKHEAPGRVHAIGAHAQGRGHPGGVDHLAGADHTDPLPQSVFLQLVHHQWQAVLYRQAHIVDKALGSRAGTAVAAVNGEEVRGVLQAPLIDAPAEIIQPGGLADHRFHAHRLAGDCAHPV